MEPNFKRNRHTIPAADLPTEISPLIRQIFADLDTTINYSHIHKERPDGSPYIPRIRLYAVKGNPDKIINEISKAILHYNDHADQHDRVCFLQRGNVCKLGRATIDPVTNRIRDYTIYTQPQIRQVLSSAAVWYVRDYSADGLNNYGYRFNKGKTGNAQAPEWIARYASYLGPDDLPGIPRYTVYVKPFRK